MEIVKRIRLLDGSEHASKEMADRHLTNILRSGVCPEVSGALAELKTPTSITEYILKNRTIFERYMRVVKEMQNLQDLKGF